MSIRPWFSNLFLGKIILKLCDIMATHGWCSHRVAECCSTFVRSVYSAAITAHCTYDDLILRTYHMHEWCISVSKTGGDDIEICLHIVQRSSGSRTSVNMVYPQHRLKHHFPFLFSPYLEWHSPCRPNHNRSIYIPQHG